MDPLVIGTIAFIIMVVLILIRVPVAVSLGVVGIGGMIVTFGFSKAVSICGTLPYSKMASHTLAVIPLFYFMGDLAREAGIARDAFNTARKWVGGFHGGMAMTTTLASGFSAACMGSSIANAAMFTRLALPEMEKEGYAKSLSLGCIAAAGTFAVMIPPSITMVIYGIMVEESVGKLLIAGLLPGIITVIVYMVSIYVRARWLNPNLAPPPHGGFPWKERFKSLWSIWGIAVLFIMVMGGIYFGVFTPSSGGAVGAFGAFIIALGKRRLRLDNIMEIGLSTSRSVGSILLIVIGGMLFARFAVFSGFVERLIEVTTSLDLPPVGIMAMVGLMYIVLGCLLDPLPMILCTVSFVFPVVTTIGYDPIWFGVFLVKLVEIGCVTPPIGVNLFVVAASAGKHVNLMDVIKGIIPFTIMDILVLLLLLFFPVIALYLPDHMI
jgi:tripartite ATP-independent transporter DctM subunit